MAYKTQFRCAGCDVIFTSAAVLTLREKHPCMCDADDLKVASIHALDAAPKQPQKSKSTQHQPQPPSSVHSSNSEASPPRKKQRCCPDDDEQIPSWFEPFATRQEALMLHLITLTEERINVENGRITLPQGLFDAIEKKADI
ncbi:hypothetical protein CAPTEDRAFT_215499 [Capitella teleta]|uniref:Uncharacterized protein n=1 Tax=Capitella teleta TaxID=283909 RepID=R7VHN8_CAPTE|nr:hypothetical protein CAPTEDRAFT_215499 [Capitella teleta]|eukprot:ELU15185.1 hypothetical protein CAPTEDRAFT_215499 [Capitella teleta]